MPDLQAENVRTIVQWINIEFVDRNEDIWLRGGVQSHEHLKADGRVAHRMQG
jgi:hypothetical protein